MQKCRLTHLPNKFYFTNLLPYHVFINASHHPLDELAVTLTNLLDWYSRIASQVLVFYSSQGRVAPFWY